MKLVVKVLLPVIISVSLLGCSTTRINNGLPESSSQLGITGVVQVTNSDYNQIASIPEKLKNLFAFVSTKLYGVNAATASDLRPLAGANVTLYTVNNLGNPLATTVTNADGRYSFPEQNNNRVYVVKAEKTNNGKTITEQNVVYGSGVQETPIDPETSVAVKIILERYETNELLTDYTPQQNTSIGQVIQDIKQIVKDYYSVPSNLYPDCTTTITVPPSISSNVSNLEYTLTVTNMTGGSVGQSPLPSGGKYQLGTVVTLTATPIAEYIFSHWDGVVTSSMSIVTLNVNSDKSIRAVFIKDIYVDDSNTSGIEFGTIEYPFNTIQEAIDISTDGSKIIIRAGQYTIPNQIQITKSITIEGQSADTVIINANVTSGYPLFFDNVSSTVISNITLMNEYIGGGGGNGIRFAVNASTQLNNSKIFAQCYAVMYNGGGNHIVNNNMIFGQACDALSFQGGSPTYQVINNNIRSINGTSAVVSNISGTGTKIFENNIVYKTNQRGFWVFGSSSAPTIIGYNNFWGNGLNYVGNLSAPVTDISADPLFIDGKYIDTDVLTISQGNYQLQNSSPCKNTGNPDSQYNNTDGSRNNMGAYGGPNPL